MSDQETARRDEETARSSGSSNGKAATTISPGEAIRSARDVVAELTGKVPEGISGVARSDDGGWAISVDVVELARIPSSTDLLATYEICLDGDGVLVDMERSRRYTRNQTDEE